ncbi:histone-like nucleoid-structuring protein Lsr2 [Streptomyces decoyicus]|uniref:Lsr2 family DNA-binding protein n=1 Tax=Streptomyces decoyicus TaxID=249567 RepID=UPI003627FB73
MVEKGLRPANSSLPVTPPEVRFYLEYKPRDDARAAQEAERKRQWDEMWERSKAAQAEALRMKEHMRKAREWGRDNGYFVGTRGRIPARVWKAYQESVGETL